MRGVAVICGWLVEESVEGVCMLPSQATDALDKSCSCPSRAHTDTSSILLAPPTSHMPPTDCAFYVYHHLPITYLIPTIVFPLKPRMACSHVHYSSANGPTNLQSTVFTKYRMS